MNTLLQHCHRKNSSNNESGHQLRLRKDTRTDRDYSWAVGGRRDVGEHTDKHDLSQEEIVSNDVRLRKRIMVVYWICTCNWRWRTYLAVIMEVGVDFLA